MSFSRPIRKFHTYGCRPRRPSLSKQRCRSDSNSWEQTKLLLNFCSWTIIDTLFTLTDVPALSSSASCVRWIRLPPSSQTTNLLLDFQSPSFRSTKGPTRQGLRRRPWLVFRRCGRSPRFPQQCGCQVRVLHASKNMILSYQRRTIDNSS